jgi:hypothetical protein
MADMPWWSCREIKTRFASYGGSMNYKPEARLMGYVHTFDSEHTTIWSVPSSHITLQYVAII